MLRGKILSRGNVAQGKVAQGKCHDTIFVQVNT